METKENSYNTPVSNRIVKLLGSEIIELLVNSNTITLYDIDVTPEINSKIITSTHFHGYKINNVINESVLSTVEDLKSFFLGLSSYTWTGPVSGCVFEPGFVVSFGNSNDKNSLSIFICFKCGQLLFQWGKEEKIYKTYFSGHDILLILLNIEFKDSKKIKAIINQF